MKGYYKKYLSFVIPSIISSVVLGTFSIVDGLFIGNKIGDIGLAAINFAWPMTAFIQAIGFGIGMAGAIRISISKGMNNALEEKKYLFLTYILLLISSLLLMALFLLLKVPLLKIFGARGETLVVANQYITVIICGSIFQVFSQGLISICRNYKYNLYTMCAMSLGFICNIFLDYLLIYVYDFSLSGAAWATLASQVITFMFTFGILLRKIHRPIVNFDKDKLKKILINTLSPFGTFFSPNIILIIINKVAVIYGGDEAVAAYTAVSYVTFMSMRLMQGIADGAQPLYSFYYGSKEVKLEYKTLKLSTVISLTIAVLLTFVCTVFKVAISSCFGLSDTAMEIFKNCLWISATSFIALAILRISMSYFYAKEKNLYSSILTYGEALIGSIVVITFPNFMGLNGIWIATPISQYILLLISIIFLIKSIKNLYNNDYFKIKKEEL